MSQNNKKILLIEDDTMLSSMYQTQLEKEGFEVLIADNGVDGKERALAEEPDLILLDVIMPQLDGFSVLKELRSNKKTKNTPIVMLTTLRTEEDIEKGKMFGASDYIGKDSMTPAEVSKKIRKFLDK